MEEKKKILKLSSTLLYIYLKTALKTVAESARI